MKKILYILSAALCLLTACEKELTTAEKLVGDWHCTAVSADAEIYLTLGKDNTFVLYQQIGQGAFRAYNGTYAIGGAETQEDGTTAYPLSGTYNDGTAWGAEYRLVLTGNDTMTLTALGTTETYTKLSGGIPGEVLRSCVTVVKSGNDDTVPFL